MSKGAIKPDFFSNLPILSQREALDKKGITDREQCLYGMSQTSGWEIFTKEVDELVSQLDQLNENAIASGATYEEIGKNSVIVSLAKGIIKRMMDKVSDAKEACESGGA